MIFKPGLRKRTRSAGKVLRLEGNLQIETFVGEVTVIVVAALGTLRRS